ncbi:hypothetical protein [Sulfitobacter sp. R18_1]|uniref:hypothetical protein n=1 Tax=Sulfitobacter sp. R18_1 TaxID=2821104 RepID=UPI001AD9FA3A|nr:hypothetical protein [Sulfitobacter sp. R18_1]MBO9428232.1 hypothetical protein [Sulfitobacter sp. R18_1]
MTDAAIKISNAVSKFRQVYLKRGISLFDIGNGLCENFAHEVLEEAFGSDWVHQEGRHGWHTLCTEQLFVSEDCGEWDWELLREHYGIQASWVDRIHLDKIAFLGPGHVWIYCDGKHYDCEHPEGVESFFQLEFFKRWEAGINAGDFGDCFDDEDDYYEISNEPQPSPGP